MSGNRCFFELLANIQITPVYDCLGSSVVRVPAIKSECCACVVGSISPWEQLMFLKIVTNVSLERHIRVNLSEDEQ